MPQTIWSQWSQLFVATEKPRTRIENYYGLLPHCLLLKVRSRPSNIVSLPPARAFCPNCFEYTLPEAPTRIQSLSKVGRIPSSRCLLAIVTILNGSQTPSAGRRTRGGRLLYAATRYGCSGGFTTVPRRFLSLCFSRRFGIPAPLYTRCAV